MLFHRVSTFRVQQSIWISDRWNPIRRQWTEGFLIFLQLFVHGLGGKVVNSTKIKEMKTMTYNKPTINVLGNAVRVIQGKHIHFPGDSAWDNRHLPNPVPPAYELDE